MTTEESLEFLIEDLKNNNNLGLTNKTQWTVLKKYKNNEGNTCRDFFNEIKNEKAIVVINKDSQLANIIYGADFLYFIDKKDNKPLFVYAPFISNSGLNFRFALYSSLIEKNIITLGNFKLTEVLVEKLKSIFLDKSGKDKDVVFLGQDNMVLITYYDTNVIIERLEQHNFKFSSEIFSYYKDPNLQPVYPDLLDIKYHFPEDQGKNSQKSIETVFLILSKGILNDENYTRVRKLLRKVSLDDLNLSKKISFDINLKEHSKIKLLYEIEIKRRKIKNYIG